VLARGAGRGRSADRPSREALTTAVTAAAQAAVAVDLQELLRGVARRHRLAADDELLLHAADDALDDAGAALALLAPDDVVHAPGLMAGAVLTHRLSPSERAEGFLVLDTDLAGFVGVATALENTGVGAYQGAAQFLIDEDELLTAALTIHGVEARHAAYLNGLTGASPFPDAVNPTLTPEEVLAAAGPFITA